MSATISVIVPTVDSRKKWLAECVASYEETTPDVELIVVKGQRSCGEAWIAGAKKATGDFIHFTADDLVALPGWHVAAVSCVQRGEIPGANVLTARSADNSWLESSTMHADSYTVGNQVRKNILVPFFSKSQFAEGDWCLPIHYGSDDWVTILAAFRGYETPFVAEYKFGHGAAAEGRLHDSRARDIPILCDAIAELGPVPPAYLALGRAHGWSPADDSAERLGLGANYFWNGPQVDPTLNQPPAESVPARA